VDAEAIEGAVRWYNAEEGWGVIDAPEVPGGCFVLWARIQMSGYKSLTSGQWVRFTFETPGHKQDGYDHRATRVWPIGG
jgi:CspA family cold shock protein